MFAAGPRLEANGILGGMRSHMADALSVPREGHEFLWVVNFPLFHWDEEGQRYEALEANGILGGMRSHMADALSVPREGHEFLWVVNFPLFHWDEEGQRYEAEHQPFTLPHVDELHLLDEDPLKMGSCTYDFVMDGFEAGGGGMRIHDAELQLKMLEFMGFSEERARAQFGFLMEALEFGAPPQGGFALGHDRGCILLAPPHTNRDVKAFPKTRRGSDLMSAAPSEVSMAQLKEVGLRLE